MTQGDPAEHEAAVRQLIRLGYDHLLGYLSGGIEGWQAADLPVSRWEVTDPQQVHERLHTKGGLVLVDVRQESEWQAGHIPGAIHIEAGRLSEQALGLAPETPIAVHCGHHDRSVTGLALLERQGFRHLLLMDGGFSAWEAAGFEVEKE